ncbi:unnamed protein product [Sympodiomycopsis kandeliae]
MKGQRMGSPFHQMDETNFVPWYEGTSHLSPTSLTNPHCQQRSSTNSLSPEMGSMDSSLDSPQPLSFGHPSPASQLSSSVDSHLSNSSLLSHSSRLPPTFLSQFDGQHISAPEQHEAGRKARKNRPGSHAKKRKSNHVPRPRNAFILFRCHVVSKQLVPTTLEKDHRNISRIVSVMWNNLSDLDRQTWKAAAQQEKDEHQRLYPDYKFQPVVRKAPNNKRNLPQVPNVEEQCEATADMLLKMMGETGLAKDEDGLPVPLQSETSRMRKERKERRQLHQQTKHLTSHMSSGVGPSRRRKRRNGTSIADSTTTSSAGDSPMLLPSDRRISTAGDLATSIPISIATGPCSQFPMANFSEPFAFQRRSSSVPPLGDSHLGVSQGDNSYPAAESEYQPANMALDLMQPVSQYSNGWGNRQLAFNESSESSSSGASLMFKVESGSDNVNSNQGYSGARKKPPPPIGLGVAGSNIGRLRAMESSFASPLSPKTVMAPPSAAYDFWQSRPKTMASATPRSMAFQITPRAPQNSFDAEWSLISPMRSSFGGFRRPSAAWQTWSRSSGLGVLHSSDADQQNHLLFDLTPKATRTSFGNVALSSDWCDVVRTEAASENGDHEVFRYVAPRMAIDDAASSLQSERENYHSNVFAFGSEFLEPTTGEAGSVPSSNASSTSSSDIEAVLAAEIDRSAHESPLIDPHLQTQVAGTYIQPAVPLVLPESLFHPSPLVAKSAQWQSSDQSTAGDSMARSSFGFSCAIPSTLSGITGSPGAISRYPSTDETADVSTTNGYVDHSHAANCKAAPSDIKGKAPMRPHALQRCSRSRGQQRQSTASPTQFIESDETGIVQRLVPLSPVGQTYPTTRNLAFGDHQG